MGVLNGIGVLINKNSDIKISKDGTYSKGGAYILEGGR